MATTSTGKIVGDSRFNETFGPPSERAVTKLKTHMPPFVQEFIKAAPFAIMATTDGFQYSYSRPWARPLKSLKNP